MKNLLVFTTAILTFAACGESSKTTSKVAQTAENQSLALKLDKLAGLYVFGKDISEFRDCDSGKTFWVDDKTRSLDTLYPKFRLPPAYDLQPVFAILEGQLGAKAAEGHAADYDGVFIVTKVDSIDFLNFRNCCESFDFWASGTEPFWNLQISPPEGGGKIVFQNIGFEEALIFPGVKPVIKGETWTYSTKNSEGKTLVAVVKKEKASDGMSDIVFPYSCEVTFGKEKFRGVALRQGDEIEEPK